MLLLFCCCLIFEIAFWFVSVKCSCRPNVHILLACVCVLCMSAHVIRMLCEHASKQSDAWFRPGTQRIMTRWTNSQPASQPAQSDTWLNYGICLWLLFVVKSATSQCCPLWPHVRCCRCRHRHQFSLQLHHRACFKINFDNTAFSARISVLFVRTSDVYVIPCVQLAMTNATINGVINIF